MTGQKFGGDYACKAPSRASRIAWATYADNRIPVERLRAADKIGVFVRKATAREISPDHLLNLRIDNQIGRQSFARKQTESRDRLAGIKLQLDVIDRSHNKTTELAT
jgi:hypothetical protein